MKTFAESRTCRREVLLDALGGEKTVCDGCDICDHGGAPADCSDTFPWGTPQDAAVVLDFVYRHRKLFRREELIGELVAFFNRRDAPVFGMCVWEHGDVALILDLLEREGLLRTCLWPWFGRIDCGLKRRAPVPKICRSEKWMAMQSFQTKLSLWPATFKKKLLSAVKKGGR